MLTYIDLPLNILYIYIYYIIYYTTNFPTFHHLHTHNVSLCWFSHGGGKLLIAWQNKRGSSSFEALQFSGKFQGQSSSSSSSFLSPSPSFFLWLVLRLYPFVCPPTNRISTWNKKRVNTRSRLSEYMGVWHETKFQRQKLYHRWIAAMVYIYILCVPPLKSFCWLISTSMTITTL